MWEFVKKMFEACFFRFFSDQFEEALCLLSAKGKIHEWEHNRFKKQPMRIYFTLKDDAKKGPESSGNLSVENKCQPSRPINSLFGLSQVDVNKLIFTLPFRHIVPRYDCDSVRQNELKSLALETNAASQQC